MLSLYFYYKTGCQVLFVKSMTSSGVSGFLQLPLRAVFLEKREKWRTPGCFGQGSRTNSRYTFPLKWPHHPPPRMTNRFTPLKILAHYASGRNEGILIVAFERDSG